MEPVQGNTSGHTHPTVVPAVVAHHLLLLWALTTTVSLDLTLIHGVTFSTLMTHCGMDKIVVDLSIHAVITQTFPGSARNFLSQLQMTWSSASVGIKLNGMRISPSTLFNSTYSESS